MEWNQGDLVWFDPGGLGHPLPGEIQEVHQAAQIIVVQAMINGKVNIGCVLEVYTRDFSLLRKSASVEHPHFQHNRSEFTITTCNDLNSN